MGGRTVGREERKPESQFEFWLCPSSWVTLASYLSPSLL